MNSEMISICSNNATGHNNFGVHKDVPYIVFI